MAKFIVDPNDTLAQEAISKKLKVYTKFNPYFSKDTQVEISTLEQVFFYHKKLRGSRVLGEVLKDKAIRKGKRKRVVKDLVKFWDKEYKENIELQKKLMLDKTKKIRSKRIRHIHYFSVYLFTLITIFAILISHPLGYIDKIPYINTFFNSIYIMMEEKFYHNLLIVIIYAAIISILYIIILRTYFELSRRVGANAEAFINGEYKKINNNFFKQEKKIKHHLLKSVNRFYKQQYQVKKIFDLNAIIVKLEEYTVHVENRIINFRKKYHWLLFIQFILKLCVYGMTFYLGYKFYHNYY